MAGSLDSIPTDGIPLDDIERAQHKFKLDAKQAEALDLIRKGLPIAGFTALLGEDLWIRELVKDLEGPCCKLCQSKVSAARSKAIQLLGEWLGCVGSKAKKKSKREVVFDEE